MAFYDDLAPAYTSPVAPESTPGEPISHFQLGAITGRHGESGAFDAANYVADLRKKLDAGQISVGDFIKYGTPAAQTALQQVGKIAGGGQKAAQAVNPAIGILEQAGFTQTGGTPGAPTIKANLPQQYQEEAFKTLLPPGTSPEDTQKFLSQIPPGLDPFSDEGKLEIEKLREQTQASDTLKTQQSLRDKAITGTGGLQDIIGQQRQIRQNAIPALQKTLETEGDRQFSLDQPGIYENLNSRGLLSSSALGEALARQKANYAGNIASRLGEAQYSNDLQGADDLNKLSAARLAGTDQDVNAIQQSLIGSNQLQQAGLSRTFSVQDFQQQAALARQIALEQMPQSSGGGGLTGAFTGAMSGAATGASVGGPWGAVIGGGIGAGGGYASGKSQASGKPTYLCTHLRELGLMTEEEVAKVHEKIADQMFAHPLYIALYGVIAPIFIARADSSDFDWEALKPRVCDDVLAAETNEEAFDRYRSVCLEIIPTIMPILKPFFGTLAVA